MIPTRQKLIGENKVEEYEFVINDLGPVVYINGKKVDETYGHAVRRIEESLNTLEG